MAFALGIVLTLTLVIAWFYGAGGETSTVAVLGAVFTAIGTLVGTVFGVSSGTKSGAAGGQQVAQATARSATQAINDTIQAVQHMKHEAVGLDSRMTAHATKFSTKDAPAPPTTDDLQKLMDAAISKAQGAAAVLSNWP